VISMLNKLIQNYRQLYSWSLYGGLIFLIISKFFFRLIDTESGTSFSASYFIAIWMLFILYVLWKKSEDNYEESDADYYYYLGFIFTISTLAISFVPDVLSTRSFKPISQVEILKSFGLGLITTILGLVGRILLYQKYEKHIVGAEDAVQRMSIVGDRFAKQLNTLTISMRTNLEQISQSYDASAHDLNKSTVKLSEEITHLSLNLQELRKVTTKSINQIEKSSLGFSAALQSNVATLLNSAESISKSSAYFSDAVTHFSTKLLDSDKINNFNELVSKAGERFAEFANLLKECSGQIQLTEQTLGSLNSLLIRSNSNFDNGFSELNDSLRKSYKTFSEVIVNLHVSMEVFQTSISDISNFPEILKKSEISVDVFNSALSKVSTSIKELEHIPLAFNSINNQINQINLSDQAIKKIVFELESIHKSLNDTSIDIAQKTANAFSSSIKTQEEFLNNLQNSQNAVIDTHSALIAAIKNIKSEFE
jgi:hypothetical protein